jgi:hypothetical protein
MHCEAFAECERVVDGLLSYCQYDKSLLTASVAEVTYGTIQYILDGEESLDDLEGCEKTVFGTKFEKRWIKRLDLPRKVSQRKNPHNLKLDTRVAGFDLDVKTTLGGTTWMIPREAVGHWLFLVQVKPKIETVSYGVFKALPEYLTTGKNQDEKVSVSKVGKRAIRWIEQGASYAPAGEGA